eukprot:191726_1
MDANKDEWDNKWNVDEYDNNEFEKEMTETKPNNNGITPQSITYQKQESIELLTIGYIGDRSIPNLVIQLCIEYLQHLVDYTSIDSTILCEYDKWVLIELLFRSNNTLLKTSNKYKLKLLYSAQIHGWAAENYHSKCDHYSPTITIINSNYDHIFGGFTNVPLSDNHEVYSDKNAFLFLIRSNPTKNDKPQIFKLKPHTSGNAIWYYKSFGPMFGEGPDICVDTSGHRGSCFSKTFEFGRNNMLCGDASINDKLSWVEWNENDFDSDDPNQFDQGFHTNNSIVKTFEVNNYEVFQLLPC